MRQNRLKIDLNILKQIISDFVSLLRHNRDITQLNETKQLLCLIVSRFRLTLRQNNNYIIINYLNGFVSLYRGNYPHIKMLLQKAKGKRSMLSIIRIDALDCLSMFFPWKETRLTGFLTSLK